MHGIVVQPVESDKDERRERKRQEGQEREVRKVELARLREEVSFAPVLGCVTSAEYCLATRQGFSEPSPVMACSMRIAECLTCLCSQASTPHHVKVRMQSQAPGCRSTDGAERTGSVGG